MKTTCDWIDFGYGDFKAGCAGTKWQIDAIQPSDCGFDYCPHCGLKIKPVSKPDAASPNPSPGIPRAMKENSMSAKSKNKSAVVNVPVESTGPVAGQVLVPDSLNYYIGPDGFAQHQNYQLPVGRVQRQYTQDGVTWINSGDPITVTSPGVAIGVEIVFGQDAGWQLVYLGA